MKSYTNDDIRKLNPSYDSNRYFSDDKEYTLLDIIKCEKCPPEDRIWVVANLILETVSDTDDDKNKLRASAWEFARSAYREICL